MGKKQKTILMTEGNIWKQILWFSIPLILGNLLQQMYNTMDSVIVGNFVGSDALAAVGASSSLLYLLIAFSTGAATGAGVVVAQLYGAGDREKVQDAVHTALGIAVVLGLILTVVGIAVSPQILVWMKTPEDIMDQSVEYLRVYFAGVVFNVIYNMAAGILNAVGNSKRSLMYLGVASFLNIGLDVFFIAVLKMGVAGAAIATDICQLISSILIVGFLMRVPDKYQVTLRKIRIHRHMAARIIQIGLPSGIQNMVISLSNVLVQTGVNGFGTNAVAGFSAYLKVDGFNILPVMSFSMAATTFTGQNYGGRKERQGKKRHVGDACHEHHLYGCDRSPFAYICKTNHQYFYERRRSDCLRRIGNKIFLPVLFLFGNHALACRNGQRNRKNNSSDGHYIVGALRVPRDLGTVRRAGL